MYINMHAKLQGAIAMNRTKLVNILTEGDIDVNNTVNSSLTAIVTVIVRNNTKILNIDILCIPVMIILPLGRGILKDGLWSILLNT
jgi:hypothetical protein